MPVQPGITIKNAINTNYSTRHGRWPVLGILLTNDDNNEALGPIMSSLRRLGRKPALFCPPIKSQQTASDADDDASVASGVSQRIREHVREEKVREEGGKERKQESQEEKALPLLVKEEQRVAGEGENSTLPQRAAELRLVDEALRTMHKRSLAGLHEPCSSNDKDYEANLDGVLEFLQSKLRLPPGSTLQLPPRGSADPQRSLNIGSHSVTGNATTVVNQNTYFSVGETVRLLKEFDSESDKVAYAKKLIDVLSGDPQVAAILASNLLGPSSGFVEAGKNLKDCQDRYKVAMAVLERLDQQSSRSVAPLQ